MSSSLSPSTSKRQATSQLPTGKSETARQHQEQAPFLERRLYMVCFWWIHFDFSATIPWLDSPTASALVSYA